MRTVVFLECLILASALLVSGVPCRAAATPPSVPAPRGTNTVTLAPLSFFGRVTAADPVANSLTVVMQNETSLVVLLQPDTKMRVNGEKVTAATFKPGETVLIRGRRDAEGRILAVFANNQVGLKSPSMAPKKEDPAPKEPAKP